MSVPKIRLSVLTLVMSVTLVSALFATSNLHPVRAATAQPLTYTTARSQYGQPPLSFIANAGQTDLAVRFEVRGSGGALGFAGDWTGSGHAGVGLFLNGATSLKNYPYTGSQPDITFAFGVSGDMPLAGYWGAVGSVPHPGGVIVPPTFAPTPGAQDGRLGD